MKSFWVVFALQTLCIAYLVTELYKKNKEVESAKALEELRSAACDSDLMIHRNISMCKHFENPNEHNCNIALSFAGMIDVRVKAQDLLSYLEPPEAPRYHSSIRSRQQFLETFADCFVNGKAAEFRVPKALFSELLKITEDLSTERKIGGNAAVMALRIAQEGCKTFISGPISREMTQFFPKRLVALNEIIDEPDIHLIIEYKENQVWGNYRAGRSNRFYANHDIQNTNPEYLKGLKNLENDTQVVVFGGFQLLEGSENEKEFLESIELSIAELRVQNKKVHAELGDFHNNKFYKAFQSILSKIDSIGFNEQELGKLLSYFRKTKFRGYPAKAGVSDYLPDLISLIHYLKEHSYSTNRLHLHTISSQVICSTGEWENPLVPAARSALISGQFACNKTDIQLGSISFEKGPVYLQNQVLVGSHEHHVTECWDVLNMECCLALVPTCLDVISVTSLGDNISAMGLAYHRVK